MRDDSADEDYSEEYESLFYYIDEECGYVRQLSRNILLSLFTLANVII